MKRLSESDQQVVRMCLIEATSREGSIYSPEEIKRVLGYFYDYDEVLLVDASTDHVKKRDRR